MEHPSENGPHSTKKQKVRLGLTKISHKVRPKHRSKLAHSKDIKSVKAFPHKVMLLVFALSFAAIGSYFLLTSLADTSVSTVKSGNWSDPSVWNTGIIPDISNRVFVKAGHNLTYNLDQSQVAGVTVEPTASLQFVDSKSSTLESKANVVIEGKLIMHPASPAIIQTLRFIGINEENL